MGVPTLARRMLNACSTPHQQFSPKSIPCIRPALLTMRLPLPAQLHKATPPFPPSPSFVCPPQALDALSPADAVPTPAEALLLLRKAAAGPDALAAASRPPPPLSPHSRDAFLQTLMRSLIAHARSDGSVAPLHIEESIGANAAAYA